MSGGFSRLPPDTHGRVLELPGKSLAGSSRRLCLELPEEPRRLSVQWQRIDNNWKDHENPCSDNIGFSQIVDDTVRNGLARGVQSYMTLSYAPDCALVEAATNHQNGIPSIDLWQSYVRQSVAHYRPMGVTHYGLWNEPNT